MQRAVSNSPRPIAWIALKAGLGILAAACFAAPVAWASDLVDLTALKGQVVYLDFWASWCAPCLASFPFMNHLQETLGPQGLTVVAVNVDRNRADAERFLRQHPAQFRVVFDPQGVLAQEFSVHGMPSSFVIDRNGVVQVRHQGFRLTDRRVLEQQVGSWITQH
jgi:cytochrome c biogenesis protein CcmG, thiol:disulfide interchange protein DsbE